MRKRLDDVTKPHEWNLAPIKIESEYGKYYFEIENNTTYDIAEAVSMIMRLKSKWDNFEWNTKVSNIDYYNIDPSKCLYWLSGGYDEWLNGSNYKKQWRDCALEYQEEFGPIVISILEKSKTLKDIKDGFIKHLNLSILYNFAIEKNMI